MFWKKNRLIDEFAHRQADEFFSHVQVSAAESLFAESSGAATRKRDRKRPDQIAARKLESLVNRLAKFEQEQRLGVYGKARLHTTFKHRLVELGYPRDLAEEIDRAMLLHDY